MNATVEIKKDFKKDHPERQDDEVFLGNFDNDGIVVIGWKTTRKGSISYYTNGKPIGKGWPDSFPVFVKISEIEASKHGKQILKHLLPKICTCPKTCDCQNPPPDNWDEKSDGVYHTSLSCTVHYINPKPDDDCPIHTKWDGKEPVAIWQKKGDTY